VAIETSVSADAQPQAQMAIPARSAPADPAASVARCTNEARMFKLSPWARCKITALPALITSPKVATTASPAPWTGTGSPRRLTPSYRIHTPAASRSRALTWAAITSARANPKLCRALTGRAVRIDGDPQPCDVGDQVRGVGEQRQRPEHDPAGDLHDEQRGVDTQCPAERAALPGPGDVPTVFERVPGHEWITAVRAWGLWS